MMKNLSTSLAALALLSACSSLRPPESVQTPTPERWFAPTLPHQGQMTNLKTWWGQFNDPVLLQWIEAAQQASPNLALAKTQVLAASAARTEALNALLPTLVGTASVTRGVFENKAPAATLTQYGVQASWPVDIWGQAGAYYDSTQGTVENARATWHEARVLIAAETAQQYFALKTCLAQVSVSQEDAKSRAETARVTQITEKAGFTAPAVAALARASAAQGVANLTQQQATCDRQIKAIAALTALPEPKLREDIKASPALLAQQGQIAQAMIVPAVPAQLLAQRPDVYKAQRDLISASVNVGVARAQLLPSLKLSGQILRNRTSALGVSDSYNTWSVGPVSLTLPLFNRSALNAYADVAVSRYEASIAQYQQAVRNAVRDTEQALVSLDSMGTLVQSAQTAAQGFAQSLQAVQARHKVGLANLNELEDARRNYLAAQSQLLQATQAQAANWIELYVAVGGGFTPETLAQEMQEAKP